MIESTISVGAAENLILLLGTKDQHLKQIRSTIPANITTRDGKILVVAGFMMIMLLGMVALALDIGWIQVTRTQLQSASDSGSLAAGTELLSGLGASAWRTPAEVQTAAEPVSVQFVAEHPAGEAESTFIDPARDMTFGRASFDGTWNF